MTTEYEIERLHILDMIASGNITAAEGVKLLNALQGPPEDEPAQKDPGFLPPPVTPSPVEASPADQAGGSESGEAEPVIEAEEVEGFQETSASPEIDPNMQKWRNFWWIPLSIGASITVVSAGLMYWAYAARGFGFWFGCMWVPFLLGVLIMALASSSKTARWLHVRVHQQRGEWPKTIAISFPLPLRLTAWFLRTFKGYIPNMEGTALDEIVLALEKTSPDAPFYVQVNEGDDGEKVEVYIG